MPVFTPSRSPGDAGRSLSTLIRLQLHADTFQPHIQLLQRMFSACCAYCPPPSADHGLQITPEITYRSEHWLPLDSVRPRFYQLYRHALTYPPVFSSSPFAAASSWAGIVSRFPLFLRPFVNPAALLQQLLEDAGLREKFLFWSFMPERFYGDGPDRYPGQSSVISKWLRGRNGRLRCLDAACGDGSASYGLARLLLGLGWPVDRFEIEGWTLEPLEAWAAAYGCFPHNPERAELFRTISQPVFEKGAGRSMLFRNADLRGEDGTGFGLDRQSFDLIICNGLLGGPIINTAEDIRRIVSTLGSLLATGGVLMVADHFHGGWKKNIPAGTLGDALGSYGLTVVEAGEGIVAVKT